MKRILLTWELGGNYGHLARLIPIADAQRALGREILFAVCNIEAAQALLVPRGYAYVIAPKVSFKGSNALTLSYTQMLLAIGYADQLALQKTVGDWLHLFHEYQPDLIVIDHSPTALLANHIAKIPVMQLGTGFEMPPQEHWIELLPLNDKQQAELNIAEQQLLVNMNHALIAYGGIAMQSVTHLFNDCQQLLATFAELDHYPSRKNAHYIGPVYSIEDISGNTNHQITWKETQRKKVFVYVWSGLPGLNQLMQALAALDIEVIAVIPGLTDEALSLFNQPNIHISKNTVSFARLFKNTDLLITHSGFGTVSAFLKHGIPVMIVPDTLEQGLIGQRIVSLGVGLIMSPKRNMQSFMQLISHLLETPQYAKAAQKFSAQYQYWNHFVPVNEITSIIENMLNEEQAIAN